MDPSLPSFEKPPVVEVVMGVQFHPLDSLLAPHLGLFWETVRNEYPECRENVPIIPQVEEISRPGAFREPGILLTQLPNLPRVFFESTDGEWLIQLQRDRFLHNWRTHSKTSTYPRYPSVRDRFFAQWRNFTKFVQINGLGDINVTQLEITYLNHIGPWPEDADIGDVLPDFRWRTDKRLLAKPETCSISFAFAAKETGSRLRATVKPVQDHEKSRLLRFELTVRGLPDDKNLENWFDSGRQWIVTAFADLTSKEWHKKWGRTT